MHQFDLKNKTAIITGGAQGFGLEIAKKFLQSGSKVFIWDIDEKELLKSTKQINNPNLNYNVVDVSNYEQIQKTVSDIISNNKIDILINNAGITKDNLSIRMNEEEWKKVININLSSTFFITKNVIKKMLKFKNGKIINITSVVGHSGNIGQANYAASKAGVIGFTKTCAKEFASRGIKVNAIAPGFIETEMTENLKTDDLLKLIPLGKLGSADQIASLVNFLVSSDASEYITGQTISIDGGMNI